jgi:replicative DNA helicase
MADHNILNVWTELADKILASILVDHGAFFPVSEMVGGDVDLWPPKARPVWKVIRRCVDSDTLPTVQAIKLRLNGDTPHEYLEQLERIWSDDDNAKIVYHVEQMKKIGILVRARSVGRDLADADSVDSLGDIVSKAEVELSGIMTLQSERKGDAESVLNSAWEGIEAFEGTSIPTGLTWFDRLTGGIWPGMNYWVAAAYKQGKTTLMRNIALNVAQAGAPIDIFCAEGSRELFTLDCVAMLATGLMLDREARTNELRLSGLFIMRAWRHKTLFTKDEFECISAAREIWAKLPIRVWDSRDGIKDHSVFRHRIKKSKLDHGARIHMGDYSQLWGNSGTLFERQSETSQVVQDIATTENVAVWMLAQKNEDSIKGGGYSAGVKGGGDAAAAADFLLIPAISEDGDYQIQLKHSRHTSGGSDYHLVNPSSGLFIDKWVKGELL